MKYGSSLANKNSHGYWLPCILSNEYKLWELSLETGQKKSSGLGKTINRPQIIACEEEDSRQTDIEYAWYSMGLYHRLRFVLLAQEHCSFSMNALFIFWFILMKGKCAESSETTFSCSLGWWCLVYQTVRPKSLHLPDPRGSSPLGSTWSLPIRKLIWNLGAHILAHRFPIGLRSSYP